MDISRTSSFMNQQNITHRNFSIIRTAMRINFLLCHFQWILNKYASRQQFSPQRCAARIIHVSKSTSVQTLRSKCCAGVIIFSLIIGAPPCCAGFTVISTYCLRLWYCAKDRQHTEQHCHAKQTGQPSFDIPHFHIKPSFLVLRYRAIFRHSHSVILLRLYRLVNHLHYFLLC